MPKSGEIGPGRFSRPLGWFLPEEAGQEDSPEENRANPGGSPQKVYHNLPVRLDIREIPRWAIRMERQEMGWAMFLLLGWAIRMGRPGLPEREPRRGGRSMYSIRGKRRVVQTIPLLKEHTNTPIGTQPECPRESREGRCSLPKILPGGQ
jgi:hypothetical protein